MKTKFRRISLSKHLTYVIMPAAVCSSALLSLSSCGDSSINKSEPVDIGYYSASDDLHDATINSLVSTDAYGRSFGEGDITSSDRNVGMFYFVWHGEHINEIYDVTKLMNENTDELWDLNSEISKAYNFHYFDEPLYGYYCSDDPWVLMRHVELLTMSGIDFLCLDLTNFGLYEENITALLNTLLKMQAQGWDVPKVTSILNGTAYEANHVQRITTFYNEFYTNPVYDSIWYRDPITNLPVVAIDKQTTYQGHNYFDELSNEIKSKITFRNSIWPYSGGETVYDDMSWMDWCYPQRVYHNTYGNFMSVSVAQHTGNQYGTGGTFGLSVNPLTKDDPRYNGNKGRGYDYETGENVSENAFKGTNLETQWDNAIYCEENIDEVFVTGWNEWIAYKMPTKEIRTSLEGSDIENIVDFCDTCDDEYSRDIEMTKDGYGDNFYLQNARLTRSFKSFNELHYYGKHATENLKNLDWSNARTYLDFEGDAMSRHFLRADVHNEVYYDNNTNRNDIVSAKMSHDANNLYIQVKTKDPIVIDPEADNNLNILLSVSGSDEPSWEGYNFILNRTRPVQGRSTTDLEAVTSDGEFEFSKVDECQTYLEDDTYSVAIPLESLGVNDEDGFTVDFKVADGMSDPGNIMNYYVDGDAAPIGRLNYRYNSKTR